MTAQEIAALRAKAAMDAVYLEWIRHERAARRNDRFPRSTEVLRSLAAAADLAGQDRLRLASRPLA